MDGTRTSHYAFELPPELIAQQPTGARDASRLMVVDRSTGAIEHREFRDIVSYVPAGDLVVRNSTRVLRARLLGRRDSGAPAEVLLIRALGSSRYEAMVRPGGKVRPGRTVHVADELDVTVLGMTERRTRVVQLVSPLSDSEAIERYGHVPLPPYITRPDDIADEERYQTVYARESGSVAAPTAGLHFTQELLHAMASRGVEFADVVLHVSAGTFRPVEVENPEQHVMHEELYTVPRAAADAYNSARARGAGVWAVGTTTVRTLESALTPAGTIEPTEGETRIFIRPPYAFRGLDHLLTNFHLPHSTLIMLVAAFAGYDLTMAAYAEAVEQRYRFFSYGDAMLIL